MRGLLRPRHLVLLAMMACCPSIFAQSTELYTWEREDSQHGLSVYTSDVPEHSYDALRLVTALDVPLRHVFARLEDFEHYPSWYYSCRRVQVLQRPADVERTAFKDDGSPAALPKGHYTVLLVQHAPPLEDRWAIVRASMTISGRSVVIEFQSLEGAEPRVPPDGVRMRVRGTWKLTPLTESRTRVALVIDVDPNVSLPAFVVDPQLQTVAVEIMRGLQRTLQPN
jgi:hypothetical protein